MREPTNVPRRLPRSRTWYETIGLAHDLGVVARDHRVIELDVVVAAAPDRRALAELMAALAIDLDQSRHALDYLGRASETVE